MTSPEKKPVRQWPYILLSAGTLAVLVTASFTGASVPIPGSATPPCPSADVEFDQQILELTFESLTIDGKPTTNAGLWSQWPTATAKPDRHGGNVFVLSRKGDLGTVDLAAGATATANIQFFTPFSAEGS